MAYRPARPGSEGNTRLLAKYGGGSKPPRQHYATGGAVKGENPALDEGMEAAPVADVGDKPKAKKADKADNKKDAKTSINIVVMPGGKGDPAAPPMPPPGAAGMAPPGPMPPMPPPGANPGMPPMRASGGRVKAPTPKAMVAEKGFQAGAGGATGRMEKAKKYGK